MRQLYLILFICSSLIFAKTLKFEVGSSCDSKSISIKEDKLLPRYTIQLITTLSLESTLKALFKLPTNLKKETKIYKIGKYFVARYGAAKEAKSIRGKIKHFKKLGFKDAYLVKTTKWHMKHSYVRPLILKEDAKKYTKKRDDKYTLSRLMSKASEAYKSGDISTALIYYELLYKKGATSVKLERNLCYLYGKINDWSDAKKIIERKKSASGLIYAYMYGAIESGESSFLNDLQDYILYDKSGRLALLAGYYYEKVGNMPKAYAYYKMAYKKNQFDPYNIMAYARALDIQKKYNKARKLYLKALERLKKHSQMYQKIEQRVNQLKDLR